MMFIVYRKNTFYKFLNWGNQVTLDMDNFQNICQFWTYIMATSETEDIFQKNVKDLLEDSITEQNVLNI